MSLEERSRNEVLKASVTVELGRLSMYLQQPKLTVEDANKELDRFITCLIAAYGKKSLDSVIEACNMIAETSSDVMLSFIHTSEELEDDPHLIDECYSMEKGLYQYRYNIYFSELIIDECVQKKEALEEAKKKKKHKRNIKVQDLKFPEIVSMETVNKSNFDKMMHILMEMPKPSIGTTVKAMLFDMDPDTVEDLKAYCNNMTYNGVYETKYKFIERVISEFEIICL